jgi:hypothetical protein
MPDYIAEPLDTNPDDILSDFVDFIRAYYPEWNPNEGQLDFLLGRFFSLKVAATADMASRVMRTIYRYFGATIVNVQPVPEAQALASVQFLISDTTIAHTIGAGTLVGLTDRNGDIQLFSVVADTAVASGVPNVTAQTIAVEAGTAGNDLSGPAQMVQQVDWIASAAVIGVSSGGADPEDDATYLNRLTNNLSLMAPRPILAADFALISQNIAGVWRAASIDNFIPPSNFTAAQAVGVAAIDEAGNAIGSTTKTTLDAYLQGLRQQNFIVNVLDPVYTLVDVNVTAKGSVNTDPGDLFTRVKNALTDYLSPANWGVPDFPLQIRGWINKTTVRYLELTTVVENVQGVDYVSSLTFGFNGGAQSTADKVMTGTFALPRPGAINPVIT